MKEKILIFGTGTGAQKICRNIDLGNFEIVAFIDNNISKQGTLFLGKRVVSPQDALEMTYDRIVICSVAYKEIKQQLVNIYHVDSKVICNSLYLKKHNLIEYYRNKEVDLEQQEVLDYLENHELQVFNYPFVEKYDDWDEPIYYDETEKLYYVFYNNKRMYLSRKFDTKEKVWEYYKSIILEQDNDSPHKYLVAGYEVMDGDIVIDVGAAEGNFALEVIDIVNKIYLVEADPLWIEALRLTFAPYKDKVEIIEAYLGDKLEDNCITVDELLKGRDVNYIKMDIEGSEIAALAGAKQTIQNADNLILNLCTYHRQNDYNEIANILQSFGYSVSPSKGYMVFLWEDTNIHKLVRGLLRAKK